MSIGNRIKELRKGRKMNQTELGEMLNIKFGGISAIESGRNDPSTEMIIKISKVFNVSTDYILTGREEPNTIKEDEAEVLELYRHDDQLKELLKKAVETKKKMINYILKELPIAA